MKISDLIFLFPPLSGCRHQGLCRVRLFVSPRGAVAVLTDLGDKNTGVSVTNAVELIRETLVARGIIGSEAILIEHYEPEGFRPATFDVVTISRNGYAEWDPITLEEASSLAGCDAAELMERTLENRRLCGEIERARKAIDPHVDQGFPERPGVVLRCAEIRSKMVAKRDVARLVAEGATERELQSLLKKDLSIIAEVYAMPAEEYICFSEFPLDDGAVDFVVFSGRSRMDVTLIEVKGADFWFLNQDSYEKLSAKIDTAAHQIRGRLGYIDRSIAEFRESVHEKRLLVESGRTIHNSLIGPKGELKVDPMKDINVRCVIIGGRSRDDLEESRRRHDFESHFLPPLRIESWESWLRKVQRE